MFARQALDQGFQFDPSTMAGCFRSSERVLVLVRLRIDCFDYRMGQSMAVEQPGLQGAWSAEVSLLVDPL
jgi:hypothetical protein